MVDYAVILGGQSQKGQLSFCGTGIVILKNNRAFIATCRHVGMMVSKHTNIFVIFNPKKTSNIEATLLSSPIFYNNTEPYIDLCVFEIPNVTKDILDYNKISYLEFEKISKIPNPNLKELMFYGYPSILNEKYIKEERSEDIIPLYKIQGNYIGLSNSLVVQPTNDSLKLKYLFDSNIKAALTYVPSINIGGMSGGPVICKHSGNIYGIFTASQPISPSMGDFNYALYYTDILVLVEMLSRFI